MDKNTFTLELRDWLDKFLKSQVANSFDLIETLIPESYLSKLNNEHLKSIPNYSSWDFNPDIIGILRNKKTGQIKLALLNRSMAALRLKEIGEMNLYAKLIDAEFAFLVSLNGASSEVNLLLLDNSMQKRLLNYSQENKLIMFSWKENGAIDSKFIIPLEAKAFLLK